MCYLYVQRICLIRFAERQKRCYNHQRISKKGLNNPSRESDKIWVDQGSPLNH